MKNKRGLTLVEVIVAIALVGIIAVGMIPAFAAQFKMTIDTKAITIDSFDTQGAMERNISAIKGIIADPLADKTGLDKWPTTEIFNQQIELYKVIQDFPDSSGRNFFVYLSQQLAINEIQTLLSAGVVRIEVVPFSASYNNMIAELGDTLKGVSNNITDEKWSKKSTYQWYVSESGNPAPVFPNDYEMVSRFVGPYAEQTFSGLSAYANRYIVFQVIPIDYNGVRGNESHSQAVYARGNEWRAEMFAWVDKSGAIATFDGTDVKIPKIDLMKKFDYQVPFGIDGGTTVSLAEGSLYVPIRLTKETGEIVDIAVRNSGLIDWYINKSINFANQIKVYNNTDINMVTKDGDISLYQFLDLMTTGNIRYINGVSGFSYMSTVDGPLMDTPNGDILLKTEGKGNINIQDLSKLIAKNVNIIAHGTCNMYNSIINGSESVTIDTTQGPSYLGTRSIYMTNSDIQTDGNVTIKTNDGIVLNNSTNIIGGSSGQSQLILDSGSDGIMLTNTNFNNVNWSLTDSASMIGGGWTNGKITVPNGKSLNFKASTSKVQNFGALSLGDTGAVGFSNSMVTDLGSPLTINLLGAGNQVKIDTNYERNIHYAGNKTETISTANVYQNLGSAPCNLEYTANKITSTSISSISYNFDSVAGTLTIRAFATGAASTNVSLTIRDKYSDREIASTIGFSVVATGAGEATVRVNEIIKHDVTFKYLNSVLSTQSVEDGKPATQPNSPTLTGYNFAGWYTQATGGTQYNFTSAIVAPTTIYAHFTLIPLVNYSVKFYNGQNNQHVDILYQTLSVAQGSSLGTLMPTSPPRNNYVFTSWNTKYDGTGTKFMADTIVNANINVYAQFVTAYTIQFNENNLYATQPQPKSITVGNGLSIGSANMPTPPTLSEYAFERWDTKDKGNGTTFDGTTVVTTDRTVYAQYTRRPMVTFDKNGGDTEANPATISVSPGASIGSGNMPALPTRVGRTFIGWNTQSDKRGTIFDGTTPINNKITVYAMWRATNFATIDIGDYVYIVNDSGVNVLFQKVGTANLLLRNTSGTTDNWSTVLTSATNYFNDYNGKSITSSKSGLLSDAEAVLLDINTIRDIGHNWWLGNAFDYNHAYRVDGNGVIGYVNKTNSNRLRPYISINNTGSITIVSGNGTVETPYILAN